MSKPPAINAEEYLRSITAICKAFGEKMEKEKDEAKRKEIFSASVNDLMHLNPPVDRGDAMRWLRAKGYKDE